jgi:hypothetical protein
MAILGLLRRPGKGHGDTAGGCGHRDLRLASCNRGCVESGDAVECQLTVDDLCGLILDHMSQKIRGTNSEHARSDAGSAGESRADNSTCPLG